MKLRNIYSFILVIFIVLGGCRLITDHAPEEQGSTSDFQSRHYPYEDFFLQQAFPEAQPNIRNFERAMLQVRQREVFRSAPEGFSDAWVTQGPGNIGARINTVAVHPANEQIIYAGFSDGGVFKTTDGGANWQPIFDQQQFLAIGDVVLDPNDPQTIYVGTGDPNISGFPSVGDGLYRSSDGGASWEFLGLRDQRIISKIIIDPTNSDRIFVSTMGLPFERNRDRGLYRSEDGGSTWKQYLFLSDQTGVIDMLMNPQNPQVLYAAGWDRIRNNKESLVRGDGAKLYKTTDGGNSWINLTNGLPDSAATRIGLAMSAQNPDVLYAMYTDNDLPEPCNGSGYNLLGIFKTEDAGATWRQIPTDPDENGLPCSALGGFAWYFAKLRVNPNDDKDLFLLGVDLWRSSDEGLNWDRAAPNWWEYNVHADKHDLVFTNNNNILLATDGGLYKTDLSTENWEDVENIPATQFYRVAYNPHFPDLYFGGAQDNGTTGGSKDDINNWTRIYGADGFQPVFHPDDPLKFYAETQRGGIVMTFDGGIRWLSATEGIDSEDSRNWDMPYLMSHHDPNVMYAGTDRVYQSISDTVPQWVAISDRLSANENDFRDHNMSAMSESPLNADLLYAATSDAQLWRGQVANQQWVKISDNLPFRYISDVIASPEFEPTVYVTHSGYKDNDNTPLIHRSDDFGGSWQSIAGDLPPIAINELLVLPEQGDSVLFVATDAGVYGTINAGENWHRLGNNMPMIPCFDLAWNETRNELVVATFARGLQSYLLDGLLQADNPTTSTNPALPVAVQIKTYPNPTVDGVWLELQNIEPGQAAELAVLDLSGKLLQREMLSNQRDIRHFVPMAHLPKGAYVLKLKMRDQVLSQKVIKE
ncbi:MAG: T9SS type A sorting domain-containing protein [Bacteroidota bacterium]